MTREVARPWYDAVVDIFPPEKPSELVYALVKRTFDVSTGDCLPLPSEPLLHDIRDPDVDYPFLPGSEFRFYRERTDVVILGSAFAPGGRTVHTMEVAARVGGRVARIRVVGRREVYWDRAGRPVIGAPEAFEEIPLDWENAYGGADGRVPVEPEPTTLQESVALYFDHPGVYPRNPFGKGYVVLPDPVDGIELPNLEDPTNPLTADNLIVGDPRNWYLQPRPRAFSWVQPLMFPRYVYMGLDAWLPGPEDERMPEVAEGYLERDYRANHITDRPLLLPTSQFHQEAPPGLTFERLEAGTPVLVRGMRPDGRDVSFRIPGPPRIDIIVEDTVETVEARLINVLIEPDRDQVSCTYSAVRSDLPRKFIAGIHGHIPVAVRVDGDDPVVYETPPTIRSQMEAEADPAVARGN